MSKKTKQKKQTKKKQKTKKNNKKNKKKKNKQTFCNQYPFSTAKEKTKSNQAVLCL